MYCITKEVYFCYGHRLMGHPGKCRHLHGHSVKAAITLSASRLNDQGMVCDFADIAAAAEGFIDKQLDHNLLLHRDDPLVSILQTANERFMTLVEHPTAEYLARMIYDYLKTEGLPIQSVALWETSSCCALYSEL
ncbi:6-carboxytetrahydropterin synthase [Candidatus Methylospira mobilis]|uniref:6-carboxy-5,6,7,8-tetrahydropterin synthase n=1 Tax=Candidatus Methylospira mobilis TaxID=1808979 RepID=A0A5Q0BE30_9GAMM|nr:6-carboxytetrahydropterin synthase [Candidatus Methylospira mobilis]QFY42070.1 6-carboxytetrahydropterin synthase [Candidatus Methylospira mobilis]WNV03077.1 6-carboxytetrahydropterin synthase [Candidatus Methylospira mobilis]